MKKNLLGLAAVAAVAALALTGCVQGEGSALESTPEPTRAATDSWSTDTLNIDFATYNPLSLIIKDKGWLEEATDGKVKINWVQSAGSSAANQALRANAIDIGSTAGSAALLARANGSPIKTIDVYSQPNWAALLVPAGSSIKKVSDLKGKSIAAAKGTDPYFFLLQALEEADVPLESVTVQNLIHADGKLALESGKVDAWAGLDPLLSASVVNAGSKIIFDKPAFNSYGFLNVTESFASAHPDLVQLVVDAYERAREYSIENPEETSEILAEVAGIDIAIASSVIEDRTALDIDPIPGKAQTTVLKVIGPIFVDSGDVASQQAIDDALKSLYDTSFVKKADPSLIG